MTNGTLSLVSFAQCDVSNSVLVYQRSPVFKHKEDCRDLGFGWRIYTDHIPSQVKGELNIRFFLCLFLKFYQNIYI